MNKKIILISIIIIILLVAGCIVLNKHKESCEMFTGGSYNLIFNTNGGEDIADMSICIACSRESYEVVPIPIKENSEFVGWYYDKDFKQEMKYESTADISPIPKKDKTGCMIGYKDITLYAKWND